MPDPGAHLWISQADSDRLGASRLLDRKDHRTYGQTIAKHQQVVEKSIKAIAAALRDAKIVTLPASHYYKHELEPLTSALRQLPKPKDNKDIQNAINRLLSDHNRLEVNALCGLAPKKPVSGTIHSRNTEYPYETAPGVWTAPALRDSFTLDNVDRFDQLSERIYQGTRQIITVKLHRNVPTASNTKMSSVFFSAT